MEYYALLLEVQNKVADSAGAYNEGNEGLAKSRMESLRDYLNKELPARTEEPVNPTESS